MVGPQDGGFGFDQSKKYTEVENIGARRLQTMFEKILERISFEANLSDNKIEVVNKAWVNDAVKSEIKPTDDKKFIL